MPFFCGGCCGRGAGEECARVERFLRGEGCEALFADDFSGTGTVEIFIGSV